MKWRVGSGLRRPKGEYMCGRDLKSSEAREDLGFMKQ